MKLQGPRNTRQNLDLHDSNVEKIISSFVFGPKPIVIRFMGSPKQNPISSTRTTRINFEPITGIASLISNTVSGLSIRTRISGIFRFRYKI